MEKKKLSLKDLVTIGVFAAIYFVLKFVVGIPLGMTAVGLLFTPCITALVSGIITMFFMAKVQKPWGTFIFVALPGVIMTLMGHTWVVLVHALIVALLAELLRRFRGYSSVKGNILTHAILSFWIIGILLQVFLMHDAYYGMCEKMMGTEYADSLLSIPVWTVPALYISTFIGGILGGILGAKVLKKHFEKAGLI